MRHTLLIIIAIIVSGMVAGANPIAITVMPGFELIGADVTVNVCRTESRVEGDYTFRSTRFVPHKGEFVEYTTRISFPVILPTNGVIVNAWPGPKCDREKLVAMAKPKETIEGQNIILQPLFLDLDPSMLGEYFLGATTKPELPNNWAFLFFGSSDWGSHLASSEVKTHISYTQPHLPGNLAAYLPVLPDNGVRKNYLVTFQAQEGTRLTPVGSYENVGRSSETRLSIRPVNLQLLKVQVADAAQ